MPGGSGLYSFLLGSTMSRQMPDTLKVLSFLFAMGITAGCGIGGWQGEPETRPQTVIGLMDVQDLSDRGPLWTIETDTASFVPEGEVPSNLKEEGLRVRARGIVSSPPDYYPDGYLLDLGTIAILND
jgi:hypothetical protein